jgi:hypothetical protein
MILLTSIITIVLSFLFFTFDLRHWIEDDGGFCVDGRKHELVYYGLPATFVLAAAGFLWVICGVGTLRLGEWRWLGWWAWAVLVVVAVVVLPSVGKGVCGSAFDKALGI